MNIGIELLLTQRNFPPDNNIHNNAHDIKC